MIQLLKRWKMAWSRSGSLLLSICVAWIATFLDVPLASSGEVPHPAGRLVIYPQSLHPSPRYPAQVSVFWIKPDGTSIDVTQAPELKLVLKAADSIGEPSDLASTDYGHHGLRLQTVDSTLFLETSPETTPHPATPLELHGEFRGLLAKSSVHPNRDIPVAFTREVISTLTRSGCNLGTCHGNLHGKGGLRLSLRGDDPDFDYYRLAAEMGQRRIDLFDPQKSLLLQKGTAAVAHQGGKRFGPEGFEHKALMDWIADGAPKSTAPEIVSLEAFPRTQHMAPDQRRARLLIQAHYNDGSVRDVTRWCRFEPSIPNGVTVDGSGVVDVNHAVDLTISVTYLSARTASRIVFLGQPGESSSSSERIAHQPLDESIYEQCAALQINPSGRTDSNAFLRRLFMVTVGRLPTSDETLAYERDNDPMRDERWVDRLLADPAFDYAWALRWSDLLRNEDKVMSSHGAYLLHEWLRSQIASDRPMKEWIAELVSSTGSTYENPPASFYRTHRDPEVAAESVAQVFLGVRIQCAKCHNHPFDRWKQDDYYGLAAYFTTVERKQIDNKPNDALDKHVITGDEVISLTGKPSTIRHPGRSKMVPPTGLQFEEVRQDATSAATQVQTSDVTDQVGNDQVTTDQAIANAITEDQNNDVLKQFARWLTVENPAIDENLANRIWYQYFGRGIVEPPDDFRESNPPSNPELLQGITEEFRASNFSLKQFSRTLLLSSAFARDAGTETSDENILPSNPYFASYTIRRIAAEPLMDAISDVTGVPTKLRTGDEAHSEVLSAMRMPGVPKKPGFLTTFGKPNRLLVCECERSNQISLGQSLAMANGLEVRDKLTAANNRLNDLQNIAPEEAIEELFLTALCRHPSTKEREGALNLIQSAQDKRAAFEDLLWALLNSKEFMTLR